MLYLSYCNMFVREILMTSYTQFYPTVTYWHIMYNHFWLSQSFQIFAGSRQAEHTHVVSKDNSKLSFGNIVLHTVYHET